MPIQTTCCEHWKDGACVLGLFGGRPSIGICRHCPQNTAAGIWPTVNAHPPQPRRLMDPAALANLRRQTGGCHGCGDAPPEGL